MKTSSTRFITKILKYKKTHNVDKAINWCKCNESNNRSVILK